MNTLLIPVHNVAKGFLEAAAECLSGEVTLCFEHAFPAQDALDLFRNHQSDRLFEPMRDTIEPHTELFYCSLTLDFARELSRLAGTLDAEELFWHVKGYDDERMIIWVHDAYGDSTAWLSGNIPQSQLACLAERCGAELESTEASIDWSRPCRINGSEQAAAPNGP